MSEPTSHGAAFFDVDETLITVKSMFEFLGYHLTRCGQHSSSLPAIRAELAEIARTSSRARSNRAYYRHFAGHDVATVAEHGREWFALAGSRAGFLHEPAVTALREHAAAGLPTVLVSGSFSACLDPIAELLGADAILCSTPIAVSGWYTGDVTTAMIGEEKGFAAARFIAERGLCGLASHAYADHESDLSLLRAVGHPVVVGSDPSLLAVAKRRGWQRLPGIEDALLAG